MQQHFPSHEYIKNGVKMQQLRGTSIGQKSMMDSYTILMRCNFKKKKILQALSENMDIFYMYTSLVLSFHGDK